MACMDRIGLQHLAGCEAWEGLITIYIWILLWAKKSAGPQSGNIFRRIPQKNTENLKKHPDPRF